MEEVAIIYVGLMILIAQWNIMGAINELTSELRKIRKFVDNESNHVPGIECKPESAPQGDKK